LTFAIFTRILYFNFYRLISTVLLHAHAGIGGQLMAIQRSVYTFMLFSSVSHQRDVTGVPWQRRRNISNNANIK